MGEGSNCTETSSGGGDAALSTCEAHHVGIGA
jgi:hypothetical protein